MLILRSLIRRVMRLHVILIIAWLALLLALVTMIVGHSGSHELSWTRDYISTYAAHALHANWITASILLSALALVCIGVSIARHHELGKNHLSQVVSMIIGAAVSGLLLLVSFKETAPRGIVLQNLDFDALRQQTIHESGLRLFFYSSITGALTVGIAVMLTGTSRVRRAIGGVIATTGLAAMAATSYSWPRYFGIIGESGGIRQRAAFLSLWIGALLLLALITKGSEKEEGVNKQY
jgi:hypothetical protein